MVEQEKEAQGYYRVPRLFMKGKKYKLLSLEARILYCMLCDRVELSQRNGWRDQEGNIYAIYTQNEVMEDFECSSKSAARVLKELEDTSLITRKRNGQGRPCFIYVNPLEQIRQKETSRDFQTTCPEGTKGNVQTGQKETSRDFQTTCPEGTKGNVQTGQKEMSRDFQMTCLEGTKGNTSYNNNNKVQFTRDYTG